MNRNAWMTGVLLALISVLGVGCDVRPAPPREPGGEPIKTLEVTSPDEREVVQQLADTQAEYRYRLAVLAAYYRAAGALAKLEWAERETENLDRAQTFEFVGVTPKEVSRGPSITQADEATLVEMVIPAREAWREAVDELILYYQRTSQSFKLAMADSIRRRFRPERTYMYFLAAEVPPEDLKPAEVIPAAEKLYEDALRLHRRGRTLGVIIDHRRQRESLMKLLQLVRTYPTSTRIAESAFHIAEIYRRYFDENYRALLWYQRSVQWDPMLARPSRLEAAKIAEFKLHQKDLALELYRAVVNHETFDAGNIIYARERIAVLEGGADSASAR